MQTRRRKISEAEPVESPKPVKQKTPKKQKKDDLVASILNEIKEENAVAKSTKTESVANGTTKQDPPKQQPLQKNIRGKPKSGRPWKDVKQK